MSECQHVTYGTGFIVKSVPESRAEDVMHFLVTGGLLGGRSLDGVTWEVLEGKAPETRELQ